MSDWDLIERTITLDGGEEFVCMWSKIAYKGLKNKMVRDSQLSSKDWLSKVSDFLLYLQKLTNIWVWFVTEDVGRWGKRYPGFEYGTLVLSNKKLYCLERRWRRREPEEVSRGVRLKKSFQIGFFIPLKDVKDVYLSGRIVKELNIRAGDREYVFREIEDREKAVRIIQKEIDSVLGECRVKT